MASLPYAAPQPPSLLAPDRLVLTSEDFDTVSVRSTAPSYFSAAPSYHSVALPTARLPPLPTVRPAAAVPWPTIGDGPAALHYRRVAQRRALAGPSPSPGLRRIREADQAARVDEDVLLMEDRRWDWFLAQLRENENRQRNWPRLRATLVIPEPPRRRWTAVRGVEEDVGTSRH